MKITKFDTDAQHNAYHYGKKAPRGSRYTAKKQGSDIMRVLALAFTFWLTLGLAYLLSNTI